MTALEAVKDAPPADVVAEEHLLGSVLHLPVAGAVRAETLLAPEDFHFDRHGKVWAGVMALLDRGSVIDDVTLADELDKRGTLAEVGGRDTLLELMAKAPAAGNAIHYAQIVADNSKWRRRLMASYAIRDSAMNRDPGAYQAATELLADGAAPPAALYGPDRQRDLLYELLDGKQAAEFYWPLGKLNTLQSGGMRRGQLVILSGYTSEGKSQFADQILDTNLKHGAKVCLYDNEMDVSERSARRASRFTGVPYSKVIEGDVDDEERAKIVGHLNSSEFWPIVDMAGWTAEEVCNHIRHHRWDLVVVDILHNFPFTEERELAAAVAHLKAAAKIARCCVVVVCHVNRGGIVSGHRRRPVRSDLRWSGDLENLADVVCFVYREQNEDLEQTEDGYIYFDKCRGGRLGSEAVRFNSARLRFELR